MTGDDAAATVGGAGGSTGPAGSLWWTRLMRALAVVGALLVVGLAVLAWNKVPNLYPEYQPPSGAPALTPEVAATRASSRAQSIVTTRASVLAALAGLGALVTIGINYRNSRTNAETLRTTQETFRVTERGHLTQRYTAAIEQLGDRDSVAIRLGGIYALEQLAGDSPRTGDQATVVEVLSAFARLPRTPGPSDTAPGLAEDGAPAAGSADTAPTCAAPARRRRVARGLRPSAGRPSAAPGPVPVDVQAAVTVLGRLPDNDRVGRADLAGAYLAGADLSGANLSDANLFRAVLSGTDLSGATLRDANLSGAHFIAADLSGAHLVDADLSGADLSGADLSEANMRGADLSGADVHPRRLTEYQLEEVKSGPSWWSGTTGERG